MLSNYIEAYTSARGLLNIKDNLHYFISFEKDSTYKYKVIVQIDKLICHCESDFEEPIIQVENEVR